MRCRRQLTCRECGATRITYRRGKCSTCFTLSDMTDAATKELLAIDDTLDRLRKRPRYYDNREVRDFPNLDHEPGPGIIAI